LRVEAIETKPITTAFAPMANQQTFDLAEMAIVTFLQAFAFGKPVLLLPVMLLARFHHGSIVRAADGPVRAPADLAGKRIGVRSYTQTTGVWVRGILHAEYGLDLDAITNVTTEGGHVPEYQEPPNVVRAPADASFKDMLLAGEIAAWISGRDALADARLAPLVDDVDAVERAWFERVHAYPINHMLVMKRAVLDEHPWVADELSGLIASARHGVADPLPIGVEALRGSLELIIDYALAQHLIPRRFTVDELFDPRVRSIG
jgi:4,5-dihydroxyphthalate decarboxylase